MHRDRLNINVSDINNSHVIASEPQQVLTIEASIKQNMDLVWTGVILITVGLLIAAFRRKRENVKV